MKKILTTFAAFFILFFATGCIKEPCSDVFGKEYSSIKFNFNRHYDKLVDKIVAVVDKDTQEKSIRHYKKEKENIVVANYVNITDLQNSSQVGFILSEGVKNALVNSKRFNVIETELSKYFTINAKEGITILSRDLKKIRDDNLKANYVLVGSYAYTNEQLIIFSKLIDLRSGYIMTSQQDSYDLNCELVKLLNIEE